jgi:hypothetical protein
MSREIMQQALDKFEHLWEIGIDAEYKVDLMPEIKALREELAKPEQEPVAWRNAAIRLGEDLYSVGPNGYYDMTAKQWLDWALSVVNTASPRKPWVSLTDEDTANICMQGDINNWHDEQVIDATEAKLKEKNT